MVELDVADTTLLRLSAAHVELAVLNINPHDSSLWDQCRKSDTNPSWTASTVQHVHDRCEMGHKERGVASRTSSCQSLQHQRIVACGIDFVLLQGHVAD